MYIRYDLDGATRYESTDLTAEQLAPLLPGATNIVVQATPFMEHERPHDHALAQANSWRLIKETSGFSYNGNTFNSDERSAMRILGAKLLADEVEKVAPGSFAVEWTSSTNVIVPLNYAGMVGMLQALGQHIISAHLTARAAKSAINAAATVEQIEAALETLT